MIVDDSSNQVTDNSKKGDVITKFIENLKKGISNLFLLALHSPKGFGKSFYLKQVYDVYHFELPTALLKAEDYLKDGSFLRAQLLLDLREILVSSFPPNLVNLADEERQENEPNAVAKQIEELVENARKGKRLILILLDDFDHIPVEDSRWITSKLLIPLTRTQQAAFVLTSEAELRLDFELRMRTISQAFQPMTLDEVQEAFPEHRELADEIYWRSGGLPTLANAFVKFLKEAQATTLPLYAKSQNRVLNAFYESEAYTRLVNEIDTKDLDAVMALGLLRRFTIKDMAKLFANLFPGRYDGYETAGYLDLIERLGGGRVQWRSPGGGYTLHDSFRAVLEGFMLYRQPDQFKQVHQVSSDIFLGLLRDGLYNYLVEALYHRMKRLKYQGYPPEKIAKEIKQVIVEYSPQEESDLDYLRQSLDYDLDLRPYISDNTLKELKTQIRVNGMVNRVLAKHEETTQPTEKREDPDGGTH